MEANPTAAPATPSPEDRPSGFSPRQLWQVPVFFVGVVAVLTACLTRNLVLQDPVRQLHQDLAEARRLLDGPDGDATTALGHAQSAVENLAYDPARGAEAFFLLGSAQLRLAERAAAAADDPRWRQARDHLREAERRGLDGDDAGRLHYRLAKLGFHTRDDARAVVALLEASKDQADDRAEALALLSQAYLRLSPPNVKKALETNQKLRAVPQVGEDVLGPAKLAGARLLLQLGQTEEARKTLEKINDQAPPAVRAEARRLLAGLYEDERKWSEAAELWRVVLKDKSLSPAAAAAAQYHLGACCQHLDQADRAAAAWTDCLRQSRGEEAQAAALALAELRLHEAQPEKAVGLLAGAVAAVQKPDDWKNSLVDLPRVRDLFEHALETCRQAGRFDLAVQTAELYARLAAPPRAQRRRAELCTDWARAVQDKAAHDAGAARAKNEATAQELFRRAADAHADAARCLDKKADRDEHLWLSAVCSYEGHDYARAAAKFKAIVQAQGENIDRQSEGWYLLGEACRNLKDLRTAEDAYKRCVDCNARFTCRARYQLAMLAIESGAIDAAAGELEQNLLMEHRDPDPEAHDKSLLALCSLLYQGGASRPQNFRRVVQHLEAPLEHLPVTPEAVRARFQLADSYRQLVAQSTVNHYLSERMSKESQDHYQEVCRTNWRRAAEEFDRLEGLIVRPELASLLTVKQQVDVPFRTAECYFNLGEYKKALAKYDELAARWGKHQLALRALSDSLKCYFALGDADGFRNRIELIRGRLAATEGLTKPEQQQWQTWLAEPADHRW